MRKWIIIVIFGCIDCIGCSGNQHETASSTMPNDSLKSALKNAESHIDSLQKVIDAKPDANPWFNASTDGQLLKRNGVDNSEAYIKKSLREKGDLIPLAPVMGGSMRFVNIQVLGSQWVIAEYEDGHIMGRTIYKYEIKQDGAIQFSIVASTDENN